MKLTASKLIPTLRVKDLLAKHVGGPERARAVSELHASDITRQDPQFCPREVVLMRLLEVERPPQHIPHALRVTFDEGKDKQRRINHDYLKAYMVGEWVCLRCHDSAGWGRHPEYREDAHRAPPLCHDEEAHLWEYREPVFHHPSGFSGALDALVQFTPSKLRMVEIKIIKAESSTSSSAPDFKTLKAPLGEHRLRTTLYLRLVAESPDERTAQIDTSVAHIVYWARGHGFKDEKGMISPFKEFFVYRNDASVDRYVRMANSVTQGIPEGVCPSLMCSRANVCVVAKQCFSGKYPPNVVWSKDP